MLVTKFPLPFFFILDVINPNPFDDANVYSISTSWATARDTGAGLTRRGGTINYCDAELSGADYAVNRDFSTIDTSSLGSSASISAATYQVTSSWLDCVTDGIRTYNIYNSSHSDTIVAGDFTLAGSTAWSDSTHLDTDFTAGSQNNNIIWTFNATGRTGINKTGYTKLCIRNTNKDVDNVAPTDLKYVASYNITGANDAILSVTYTVGVAGGARNFALLGVGQ